MPNTSQTSPAKKTKGAIVNPPSPCLFSGTKKISILESPGSKKKLSLADPDNFDDKELKEVARIRYDHYQIKRLRKLQLINSFIERKAQ
mmetsp:Transcript_20585/g.31395  ORF Transcript_20585/g.31395 Transcript_20585/m.31395 type:complete len:89 (-) Transcript_20585:1962-2228(-)